MNVHELLARHALRPAQGVPDWMIGWFKRYSISFADGQTDTRTHVCWLQSRNFTIDLRLPRRAEQPAASEGKALTEGRLADIHPEAWARWSDFEGWKAPASWDGHRLTWHTPDASLQWHDRWPEPAILHRVGQCMVEFCDSGAYVEDWRLQASAPGPLLGLHLLYEQDEERGVVHHVGGGWIICGDHAALVRGHAPAGRIRPAGQTLSGHVSHKIGHLPEALPELARLFDFETSVATWDGSAHRVLWSTRAERIGEPLCPTEGLTWLGENVSHQIDPVDIPTHLHGLPRVKQSLVLDGRPVVRHFAVDALEPQMSFGLETACTDEARRWMQHEARTLARYTTLLDDAHPDPVR